MNERELELIRALDWRNDEAVQDHAIKQLVGIGDEHLELLVQPFGDKAYWQNAAVVLAKIGYPRVRPILSRLLWWVADLNWPGAREIFNLLLSVDNDVLFFEIEVALRRANNESDYMWIAAIKELIVAKGIDGSYVTPELDSILKLADLA